MNRASSIASRGDASSVGYENNMDDFIDNEAEYYDEFDTFGKIVFDEEPIDEPGLATIFENETEENAADMSLVAAESAQLENEDEARAEVEAAKTIMTLKDATPADLEDENVAAAQEAEAPPVSDPVKPPEGSMAIGENPKSQRPYLPRTVASRLYQEVQREKRKQEEAAMSRIPKKRTIAIHRIERLDLKINARIQSIRSEDAFSYITTKTVARRFLVPGVRLEELSPDKQARIIHGDTNFNNARLKTACCALCGFKFENRGSIRSGKVKELAISYDHFIPINFAATVFRVVSNPGKYSDAEFKILRSIGDMVCWHCNYTKGQAMFITCPKGRGGTFDNLKVNTQAITKFFNDLLTSKSIWAYNTTDKSSTSLSKCIGSQDEWLSSRIAAISDRATQVINLIKKNVDFEKAKKRLELARATVRRTLQGLEREKKWKELQRDMKNPQADASKCMKRMLRFRRELVAKAFAREEVTYPLPWKRIEAGILENADEPFTDVVCEPVNLSRAKTGGAKTRRRRLPKLV